jgi:hypothetical protein
LSRAEISPERRGSERNKQKHEQHRDACPDDVQLIGERAAAVGDHLALVHWGPPEVENPVHDKQTGHNLEWPPYVR